MRLKNNIVDKNKRNWLTAAGCLIMMVSLFMLLPTSGEAAQYYVWGRVYCAGVLPEGEEAPINPLTGVPQEQIVPANMVARFPRNMVTVRVLDTIDGSVLGSSTVIYDGGFFMGFDAPGPDIEVTFVVEDLATSELLLESEPEELASWPAPNVRYLLTSDFTEINDDREFAECPDPDKHLAIFTRVGLIELATELDGVTHRLIDASTGLVNVPQEVSDYLRIPKYQDAPLGGRLLMFGAFSENLYDAGAKYKIKVENLATSEITYIDDPLIKTKYSVDLTTLTVTTDRVALGPDFLPDGTPTYAMTPLSAGNVFWSFPDLLANWRTGGLNGNYQVTLEIVEPTTDSCPSPPVVDDYTTFKMNLDNTKPTARIQPLYTGAGDTPRMYTPGPAVPLPYNLQDSMLGTSDNYGSASNPVCDVLDFTGMNDHLAFKLTAFHNNNVTAGSIDGFLRYWHFSFKRNDGTYHRIIGKRYDGDSNAMIDYPDLKISTCNKSDLDGFQDKYLYLNKSHIDLGSPDACGYRFVIRAATRTTDGYHYLRWSGDEDIHCLKD